MQYEDHIFQLYMHKLSGDLTPEEEAGIERKLEEDPAFREAWRPSRPMPARNAPRST